MTWFKLDDSFYDHPKVFDAPDCAVALWTRAGCWSARNLTDGFVPAKLPARLCDDPDTAVGQLLDRGLWKRTRGGYVFHDWDVYQPSRAEVQQLKQVRAEAGRRGGQAKAAKQNASNGLASARPLAKQNSAPTRPVPDPTLTSKPNGDMANPVPVGRSAQRDASTGAVGPGAAEHAPAAAGGRTPRGTRIPPDFAVTPEMVTWANEHTPHVDGRTETAAFIDYWRSKTGANATKLDWTATWRNWMRKATPPHNRGVANGQPRESTTDQRVRQGLALAAKYEAAEAAVVEHPPTLRALPGGTP